MLNSQYGHATTGHSAQGRAAARRHAERSLDLDPLDPFTNFTMGRAHWLTHELEASAEWLDRATTLNPNYAQGFYASAFTSMLIGDEGATACGLDTALQLSGAASGVQDIAALQLIANTLDWALDDAALTSIRARGQFNRTLLPMDESSQQFWEYLNYGLALLLLAGLILLQRSLHKRRQLAWLKQLAH